YPWPLPRLALRGGRERLWLAVLDDVIAAETPRLGPPILGGRERRDRDPARLAQGLRVRAVGVERHQNASPARRFRKRAQDRVGVERAAGCPLGRRRIARLIAAAAAQSADRPMPGLNSPQERKADPAVTLE